MRIDNNMRTLILNPNLENIITIESFILAHEYLNEEEKNKLLIISSEIFENIVHHAKNTGNKIYLRVYKNRKSSLIFWFKSTNFDLLISNINKTKIYYDNKERRYRGMGVRMCYNLSECIHYRITSRYNAISVSL